MVSRAQKERNRLSKIYGKRYKRHFMSEGYYCFYCGDPADCLDHCPPLSIVEDTDPKKLREKKIPHVLLPCCHECNTALGDRYLLTVEDRLLYLESFYDAFLKKQKGFWTQSQVDSLEGILKEYIRHHMDKVNRYTHKIRNIQLRTIRYETHPVYEEPTETGGESWDDEPFK
jgi:hypothetical protein